MPVDIDEILAEEERIPCVFQVDAKDLGFLDTSIQVSDLPMHSKVDLPLWLAQNLVDKNMVELEIPKYFGPRMRDEIMAGPSAIKLKDFSFYFYDVGMKLCRILRDTDLQRTLRIAFSSERFKALMVRSLSTSQEDVSDFTQQLLSTELTLFNSGYKAACDISHWRSRQTSVIKEASILRRKRTADFDRHSEDMQPDKK